MSTILRDERGTLSERVIVLAVLALAGLAGFTTLGDAFDHAISTGHRPGRAAPALASQAALSEAARLVEEFESATRGLYKDVPLRANPVNVGQAASAVLQGMTRTGFRNYVLGLTKQQERLLYDASLELSRLVKATGSDDLGASGAQALYYAFYGDQGSVRAYLQSMSDGLKRSRIPVPRDFFDRVRGMAAIYDGGIDEARRARLFGDAGSATSVASAANATDEFASFIGRYPGVNGAAFRIQYLANPERALAALPEGARRYIQGEILPFLEAEFQGKSGYEPYLSGPGRAGVLAEILAGDGPAAKKALQAARISTSRALPKEMSTAVEFAARLFEPTEESRLSLRQFDASEAEALIRIDDDLSPLRARPEGGEILADLLESVSATDISRAPGRTQAHQDLVLEGWIRSVAQGDPEGFERFKGFAKQTFETLPATLSENLEEIMNLFRPATEAP